jgi:RNA polymerase sigma-70 factor (ECF subfamily)
MDDDDRASTDARLLTDLATDLDGAFEALVVAHQDRLYSIALRMLGDPGAAEEAAQDALVRAYRALAGYDAERILALRLRGWLATIVLNRCRSELSRRPRTAARSLEADPPAVQPLAPGTDRPDAVAARRAERTEWAARLASLPVAYRAAVVLRHVDGLSYPDIALALERPEGTVKAQVHRGIAQLRTMLEAERALERQESIA